MSRGDRPVTVAIVNDYELVVAGVAALLAPYADRVRVVELDVRLPVRSAVDIVLYDTFGQAQGDTLDLDSLVADGSAKIVIYSWNVQPELIAASIERGASAYILKSAAAQDLVAALEDVHDGRIVLPQELPTETALADAREEGAYPGREQGLTYREAEIVALITQGLTNQEIAERSYLSINSIKTYIRGAYQKMGVTRRSQAVLWGVQHGMRPDVMRSVNVEPD
jgi:two-component system, NarL family, response regulator LiaR